MQTEYQRRNPFSIARNTAVGIAEEIIGTEVAQLWSRGGGPMAQPLSVDRRFRKEAVQQLMAQSPKAKALNWAKHPVDSLRSVFSLTEGGPRLAEFRAALERLGWKPGQKVTFEQYMKAQIAAANVSVDFREAGWIGQWLNQIVPFFNASIQGANRMAHAINNRPVATIGTASLWLTLPTLLLWFKQKDEEWYQDLSPMERYRYWHVRVPSTETILRIPKPFEWGHIFSSIPEAALQSAVDQDADALKESASTFLEDVTPTMIPGLAEAPAEIAADRDFYFDTPLVGKRLQSLEAQDQYRPYTTATAKAIGRTLNVAPIYVEHLASGWTGGLATQAVGAIETMAGVTGKKSGRRITGGASTLPVVGRLFLSKLHTRQFDDFYSRLEQLEQKHGSLEARGKSDASITMLKFMRDRASDLAELRRESRAVLINKSMSDKDKRDKFINIHLQMVQMAKEVNDMNKLHRPSTPAKAKEQWQKIHKEYSQGVIYNASKSPPNPAYYRGKDIEKAKKEYESSRELEKHRALAVAESYDKALEMLQGYWKKQGWEATDAFSRRRNALADLYKE
jgi:hypothetical protein